jgi:hypothetical protein
MQKQSEAVFHGFLVLGDDPETHFHLMRFLDGSSRHFENRDNISLPIGSDRFRGQDLIGGASRNPKVLEAFWMQAGVGFHARSEGARKQDSEHLAGDGLIARNIEPAIPPLEGGRIQSRPFFNRVKKEREEQDSCENERSEKFSAASLKASAAEIVLGQVRCLVDGSHPCGLPQRLFDSPWAN